MATPNKYLSNVFRILLCGIVIVYVLNPFLNEKLDFLLFIFGVAVMILSMPSMNKGYRTPAIVFLIAGLALIVAYKQPFSTLVAGAGSMMNLVSILVVMQLFAAPVVVGNYGPAVERLIVQYAKKEKHLFLIVTLVSCLFASFLLMGTIPVILALLGQAIANNVKDKNQFTSTAITRGYTAALLWAPGAVVVLLTLQATNTQWTQIFPYAFLLCILGLVSSYVLESRLVLHDRPVTIVMDEKNIVGMPDQKRAWIQMLQIVLVVIGIIAGIYMFDSFTGLSATHCVVLTGAILFVIWMTALRKNHGKTEAMGDYWKNGLLKSQDLASMFVAIGIFAEAVKGSGIIEYIQPFLSAAASHEYLFLAVLPAVIIVLSLFGIHSFISITIVGNLLASVALPFSMIPVATAILAGSALSFAVSPFAGITLTMSKYLDCNSFDVAVRWNGLYSICLYVESVILIWLMVFFKF